MVSMKSVLGVCVGSCIFGLSLFAETVDTANIETTDTTNMNAIDAIKQRFFPNAYSGILLRNYQETDSKNPSKLNPTWQVRYSLGSKFFDDSLDTKVVFGVTKDNKSTKPKDRGTRIETSWELFSNDNLELSPYMEVHFPKETGQGYRMLVGMKNGVSYGTETSWGDVAFSGGYSAHAQFSTKAQKVALKENGRVVKQNEIAPALQQSLGLTVDDDELQVSQRSPQIEQEISAGISWDISAAKGLSLSVYRVRSVLKVPQMNYDSAIQSISMLRSGALNLPKYDTSAETWDLVSLAYEVNDTVALSCDGYLGSKLKGKRQYKVISSMNVALF